MSNIIRPQQYQTNPNYYQNQSYDQPALNKPYLERPTAARRLQPEIFYQKSDENYDDDDEAADDVCPPEYERQRYYNTKETSNSSIDKAGQFYEKILQKNGQSVEQMSNRSYLIEQRFGSPKMYFSNSKQFILNQPIVNDINKATGNPFINEDDWSFNLFECCEDCGVLCYGLFCPCLLAIDIFTSARENCLTPLICPLSCIGLRGKIRTTYKIRGSQLDDTCAFAFCPLCILCQIKKELIYRGEGI